MNKEEIISEAAKDAANKLQSAMVSLGLKNFIVTRHHDNKGNEYILTFIRIHKHERQRQKQND